MTRNNGFTLIELLLYVGVAALMLSSIIAFFFLFLNARVHNAAQREVEQQGNSIMHVIADSIQQASAVATPTPGNQTGDLSTTLYDGTYGSRHLYLDGTTLTAADNSGTYALNSSTVEVSGLSFKNVASGTGHDSITVTFTVTTHNTSGRSEYTYEDTFTSTFTRR